ncbi:MAG: M13 family metallopeptidase [Cyclobacteriaceae bacterium]|nr:M13 family metallopeptidase [Cyclobacteriaceae bacterium]
MHQNVILFVLLIFISACSSEKKQEVISEGLNTMDMDTTVRPQDDLFHFANGGWLARTQIPADRGSWNSFSELYEHNNSILLEVLKEAADNPNYIEGTDQRKASDFYSIGMDSLLAEKVGVSVLRSTFTRIEKINSHTSLQEYLVHQELEGGGAFFGFSVFPDLMDSKTNAAYLGSGGLGLPERDYYLKTDDQSKETRAKYVEHVMKMLQLSGESIDQSKRSADKVMTLETQLAKATLTKEESRNPSNLYNKRSLPQLQTLVPDMKWKNYFDALGVELDSIIVTEPEFIKECQKIFGSERWTDIQAYLKWTAINGAAPYLNHAFVEESFEFNSKYLRGTETLRPRWKRVLNVTDNLLGDAIGQLYVDKAFPPEAKKKALQMVENIKLAMADRIKKLDWMTDSTKRMALQKLSSFTVKIGYPDEWKSYAGLLIEKSPESSSYYQNVVNASQWAVKRNIQKLGKPVDRKEWQMTPQTVNAYYNPLFNEIVFPAGILQPPFYNYKADEAVNYGGIGAVIGHEISHGFDDSGSKFDAEGNLKNWWKEEDLKLFKKKGSALAEQFNAYEVLPEVFVQGEFTLGENIGDLGGITVAYEGLQRFLRENGRPGLIDGYTPEQRFFISWATIWRSKDKQESLRTQVNTDPHAPNLFRANGPISNVKYFYEAFDLKPDDKLYREEKDRVQIW